MTKLFQRNEQAELAFSHKDDTVPLVSVYIISYNNVHFLYHAIKSVLAQTYGNLEITISDDASVGCTLEDSAQLVCLAAADLVFEQNCMRKVQSNDYPWREQLRIEPEQAAKHREELKRWEEQARGAYQENALELVKRLFPQVRRFQFRRNRENLGTVKHLKELKRAAAGKYVMFLAADDKLHDRNVIRDMITHFEKLPEDAYVLTSQCGMYDENLCNLLYYAVNDELKSIILNSTPQQLFGELADWCIIPAAGTIYKKRAFEIYGDLDERYHLIEDWTYFLKLARSNARIYFYDRLTYMHRDGGISHGNTAGGNLAYRYYLEDCILLTQQEILPYLKEVTPNQRKRALTRYRNTCREYVRKYQFGSMSKLQKVAFFCRYRGYYVKKVFTKAIDFFNHRAKWAFFMGSFALILSFLISLAANPAPFSDIMYRLLGCGGFLLFFGALVTKCLYVLKTVLFRS